MESRNTNSSLLHNVDWFTIAIYLILVIAGIFSIYAASYDLDVYKRQLMQQRDLKVETPDDLTSVTLKSPDNAQIQDMLFANKIVKHSKSNAIVLARCV